MDSDVTSFVGKHELESSPIVQSYITALGFIARERQELVLFLVLYKTKTVDVFLVKNANVTSGNFCGPIEMFRMLPIQYNLTTTSSIKLLIKHLGPVLFYLCEKLKTDDVESPEDVVEITELPDGVEPPRKKSKK